MDAPPVNAQHTDVNSGTGRDVTTMKLAVSNIAWNAGEEHEAYRLLEQCGVRGLEIAPALWLHGAADAFAPSDDEANRALDAMHQAGLSLVSMQSLLYGVEDARLFGTKAERERFQWAMLRVLRLAKRFSVPNLVFGSPRQRVIPEGMSAPVAMQMAVETFQRLADVAMSAGTVIAIETNPPVYGTNFLTTVPDTVAFVERVAHPALKLNLDIGAMHFTGTFSTIKDTVEAAIGMISHVHLSEPGLSPAPARVDEAAQVFAALEHAGYPGWCSIEMKRDSVHGLDALAVSLARAVRGFLSVAQQ